MATSKTILGVQGFIAIGFLLAGAAAFGDEAPAAKSPPFEELYGVRVDGKRGYINREGKIIIQPQFEQGGRFQDGLTWAGKEKRIFYINTSGKEAFKCPFTHDHGSYSDGFVTGSIGLKFHFIDTKGKLLPGFFANTRPFSDGMAAVCVNPSRFEERKPGREVIDREGKWGFIDTTGKLVIAADYWRVGNFSHGLARVLVGGSEEYPEIGPTAGKWGYVNKRGEIVIKAQYSAAFAFSEGLAKVYVEETGVGYKGVGYIDVTGKMIIEPRRYYLAWDFHDGVAIIRGDSEFKIPSGYIDKQGKITELKVGFDGEKGYSEGLAVGLTASTWNGKEWIAGPKGFVDKQGEWVVKPQFKWANPFKGGIAAVGDGDSYGYIDKTGTFIWPMTK